MEDYLKLFENKNIKELLEIRTALSSVISNLEAEGHKISSNLVIPEYKINTDGLFCKISVLSWRKIWEVTYAHSIRNALDKYLWLSNDVFLDDVLYDYFDYGLRITDDRYGIVADDLNGKDLDDLTNEEADLIVFNYIQNRTEDNSKIKTEIFKKDK